MRDERVRGTARRLAGVVAVVGVCCWAGAGVACADETNAASHNGPRVALVNMGQVDDPMEDVLEHTLLFGDGYAWS
ncbi:hypothetical protein ACFYOV_32110 [Streptomyces sp. NPDC005931]|uniref:hypothetical protein n=1 Tax=Streptomyces sp. NPDC005931 TaxID=3364737 RepID=UPI0036A9C39B